MKRLLMFFLTITLASTPCILFITCSKSGTSQVPSNDGYFLSNSVAVKANATIVSADKRDCVCCGGFFLTIDGQKPVAGPYFLADILPGGYSPANYPVKVYIEWEKDLNACINDKIIIKKLVKL